jgi:hypothetical protein
VSMSEQKNTSELQILQSMLSERSKIVDLISTPLRFYTLALLIIETFILVFGIFVDLPTYVRVSLIGVGITLFLYVLITVNRLVEKRPTNLIFSERSYLEQLAIKTFGTSSKPITGMELHTLPPVEAPVIETHPLEEKSQLPEGKPKE